MTFEATNVYHQEFQNGDRIYFLATEQHKNGRWAGYQAETNRKPVGRVGIDATVPGWKVTPVVEIPWKLAQL